MKKKEATPLPGQFLATVIYCWGKGAANVIKQRSELCTSLEQPAEVAGSYWAQPWVLQLVGSGDGRQPCLRGSGNDFSPASAGNSGQEAVAAQPLCAHEPAVTELPP